GSRCYSTAGRGRSLCACLAVLVAVRALTAWLLVVPPPHRLLVERRELGRHLAGLVDAPPGVNPVEGPLDDLADKPAQPAGLRDAHGELVLALDEQRPWQPLGPPRQVGLLHRVVLVQ